MLPITIDLGPIPEVPEVPEEPDVPDVPKIYDGWRGKHSRLEAGAREIPYEMPSVIPPIDQIALEMTKEIQIMSFELMRHVNATITGKMWRKLHRVYLCLNNKPQDGFDGGIPHRDYVNGIDLDAATLPRYDKMQRTFQGTFIRGEAVGNRLVCTPGVHGIDARKLPYPSPAEIVAKNWYVIAVSCGPERNLEGISHFAQGKGGLVVYPFIFDRVISFDLSFFARWKANELPNPLKAYG